MSDEEESVLAMTYNKEKLGRKITQLLYDEGMIETWYRDKPEGWTLVSGIWSPFYINLRAIVSKKDSTGILREIGTAMGEMIREEIPEINKLVGVYIAGIPLATAITITSGIPSCFARHLPGISTPEEFDKKIGRLKEGLKKYGQHLLVEGDFCDGDRIAIVDDLVTKFGTKLVTHKQVSEASSDRGVNISCRDVVVLIDREQGAAKVAKKHGMRLWALIPFKSKGIGWLKDRMDELEFKIVTDYLKDERKYQDSKTQMELLSMALRE